MVKENILLKHEWLYQAVKFPQNKMARKRFVSGLKELCSCQNFKDLKSIIDLPKATLKPDLMFDLICCLSLASENIDGWDYFLKDYYAYLKDSHQWFHSFEDFIEMSCYKTNIQVYS